MNLKISKIAAVCSSIVIAVFSVLSVCTINVYALDQDFVRGGTVPVVLYLKDVYLVEYIPEIDTVLSRDYYGNELEYSNGAGFFVGKNKNNPQYIVTNHHVVDDYIKTGEGGEYTEVVDVSSESVLGIEYNVLTYVEASSCELRVYYSDDDYEKAYVECYGNTEKLDLAVLSLKEPTNKRHSLKIAPVSNSSVSETIYTVGYPGNADNEFSKASRLGINDSTVHKGTISRIVRNEQGIERVSIDAAIQHGNSGGPLVSENGYVLGVNTNVISNSHYADQIETDYYAISSNELMEFLEKNNIPYQKAGGNKQIIIIIAVGVVIIAAAAVIIKKKVVPAVKTAPSAPAIPIVPPQTVSAKQAFIRSMSAQHNGKTFPVGKAPVVIGRDPSNCVIIFTEGTQGVSGIHCSVSYDSETDIFTLTDLDSTYGTFLIGGQQVPAKTSLAMRSGDSFYVGDRANICRVEVVK